jgi:hypothetical protein
MALALVRAASRLELLVFFEPGPVVAVVPRDRDEVHDVHHAGRVWDDALDGGFHLFEPAVLAIPQEDVVGAHE